MLPAGAKAVQRTPIESALERQPLPGQPRLCGIVLEVEDVDAARTFYAQVFGDAGSGWRQGKHSLTYCRGQQRLDLVERARPHTLTLSGQHQAYYVDARRLPDVVRQLREAGHEVSEWREDHPAERSVNAYVLDPSGNRVQLAPSTNEPLLLHHACIELHDLELAELFYARTLGGAVDYCHGWAMDDYAEAAAWAEGRDPCAPWTRRFDVRYWDKLRIARPNMQTFVRFGEGLVGLILATEHRQEPPPDQQWGTPRLILDSDVPAQQAAAHFASQDLAFEREGSRLFLRDPGGNYVELVCG